MDVQMPHCDGYEATRLIRKHSDPTIRNILIIAMTASAIQGDREKCLDSGMNNYLAKPVRAQTLKALLESYLSKEEDGKGPDEDELKKEAKKMVEKALNEADKTPKKAVKGTLAEELDEKTRLANVEKSLEDKGNENVRNDSGIGEGLTDDHAHESAMAGVVREAIEKPSRPSSMRQITAQRIPTGKSEEHASLGSNSTPNSSTESIVDNQKNAGS
jgi:response regulator RpfG family c-di-GMP phosphodiesterase